MKNRERTNNFYLKILISDIEKVLPQPWLHVRNRISNRRTLNKPNSNLFGPSLIVSPFLKKWTIFRVIRFVCPSKVIGAKTIYVQSCRAKCHSMSTKYTNHSISAISSSVRKKNIYISAVYRGKILSKQTFWSLSQKRNGVHIPFFWG